MILRGEAAVLDRSTVCVTTGETAMVDSLKRHASARSCLAKASWYGRPVDRVARGRPGTWTSRLTSWRLEMVVVSWFSASSKLEDALRLKATVTWSRWGSFALYLGGVVLWALSLIVAPRLADLGSRSSCHHFDLHVHSPRFCSLLLCTGQSIASHVSCQGMRMGQCDHGRPCGRVNSLASSPIWLMRPCLTVLPCLRLPFEALTEESVMPRKDAQETVMGNWHLPRCKKAGQPD
jgi:hypothetical protein